MTPLNIIPQNITPQYPIYGFNTYKQQSNYNKENMSNTMSTYSMMLMKNLMEKCELGIFNATILLFIYLFIFWVSLYFCILYFCKYHTNVR